MTQYLLAAEPNLLMSMLPMVAIIAVFWLLFIRPQRKREKAVAEMRSKIEVGDEITTIGGIIGTVVISKDDYLVLETASDRSKIRLARWAVQANNTASSEGESAEAAEGPDLQ